MIREFIRVFKRPSPLLVATQELVEAELEWLKAESGREYAISQCDYNEARVKRLKAKITELMKESKNDTQ